MSTILKGNLKKLGEKGPRKSWKNRFFIQRGTKLYYYVNEKSAQEKGFINLEDALVIQRSEKPTNGFQIQTAKRIYYLQADSADQVDYWINGTSKFLQKSSPLSNPPSPSPSSAKDLARVDSQLPVQLDQAESRIADLEAQNAKLNNVIEYIANQFKCPVVEIFNSYEFNQPLKLSSSSFDQNNNNNADNNTNTNDNDNKNNNNDNNNDANNDVINNENKNEDVVVKETVSDESNPQSETISDKSTTSEEKSAPEKIENLESNAEQKLSILAVKESQINAESDDKVDDGSESDSDDDSDIEDEDDEGKNESHFGALVLFEYSARKNYELSITANEVITVLSKHENGWWLGCNSKGVQGYFPGSYVRPLE